MTSIDVPFMDLAKQYGEIRFEVDQAISTVVKSTEFIGGSFVETFEYDFANYLGASNCIGVGNGTDALEIALEVLDLPSGSEVLVPANSFVASAEAVVRSGLRPVFIDVDETHTIDLESARKAVTDSTSAIIAVHLYGNPCDLSGLLDLCETHGLRLIEDCAQAHGAEYRGQRVGTFGDAAAFSFYPGKNLGAYGDAGALVFREDSCATEARQIANHGRSGKFDHITVGRNSRLDSIQAAILSVKLRHLDAWIDRRESIAQFYLSSLKDSSFAVVSRRQECRNGNHLFVLRSDQRDAVMDFLSMQGVQTGMHYPQALPALQAFRSAHFESCRDMRAVIWSDRVFSVPCNESMNGEQVEQVAQLLIDFDGSNF